MRILFVTSNRLGDAVLSTGLLDHLIRTHPDARITVVCGPVAEGLFARMPNRDRTIVLSKQKWGLHWLPLWGATVTRLWDLVVDIRGSALSWLVLTRARAVFGGRVDGPKINQIGALLGLSAPLPVVWTTESDRTRAGNLLHTERPIIALAPTANWQPKIWPADRFAEAFRHLAAAHIPGAIPAILGGPGSAERALAAPLQAVLPDARDLVGVVSLPEAASVLQRAALFIGNDSGLMHLAAAAGAPTIGLFGPTDAGIYGPAGPRAAAVVGSSMEAITVRQVVDASTRLLVETQSGPAPSRGEPLSEALIITPPTAC
ncbi:MAG TPA: glycosyltransferase family 9 protein [Rhodopila sp.]|jgi:ADP-heptose:LPS heptosyltransferase